MAGGCLERGPDRARADELVEVGVELGRAEQDGRPAALAAAEPAFQQLAGRSVAGCGADESEQRALTRIGAEAKIERAAEQVTLDEQGRPAFAGERGERGGALTR